MKFLPIPKVEQINRLLNFDTADCRVSGGCDMYTTKAAGVDKKLYKLIERDLELRHEADLRLSASLSPPHDSSALLSRNSPFGPLDQPASRRTFAYLIATLNASHPDYDFSGIVRPGDFRRERSLRNATQTIETTLFGLGRMIPGLWQIVDQEMGLGECLIYQYVPEDGADMDMDMDEAEGEEVGGGGKIWSVNYFFYSKSRKRVCYFYLKGVSRIGGGGYYGSSVRSEEEEEVVGGVMEGMEGWGGKMGGVGRRRRVVGVGRSSDEDSWDDMDYDDDEDWVGNMDV